MNIKIYAKPKGIPEAQVLVTCGVTPMGAPQVAVLVRALDVYGLPNHVGRLVLSATEARAVSEQLAKMADEAEKQAGGRS